MNLVDKLRAILGLDSGGDLEELRRLLEERQVTLQLGAIYEEPRMDQQGEPTAVFPITLTHGGEEYDAHKKEFVLPDDGLNDTDSALVQFVAAEVGVPSEDVTFADLAMIEGHETSATLKENGEIEVAV